MKVAIGTTVIVVVDSFFSIGEGIPTFLIVITDFSWFNVEFEVRDGLEVFVLDLVLWHFFCVLMFCFRT